MKKLIFSFFIFVIAGFVSQTIPAHAADSPPAAAVLGPGETQILVQALDILESVLQNIKVLLASAQAPIPESAELNLSLEAIKGKLMLLNSTIESEALAYAKRTSGKESTALSPPAISPPVAKESPSLFSEPEEVSPNEQVAVLARSASRGSILWVTAVLLVIALGLVFLRWRKKKEPKAEPVLAEEPQKPIVPMVREDNIQGIPPDY